LNNDQSAFDAFCHAAELKPKDTEVRTTVASLGSYLSSELLHKNDIPGAKAVVDRALAIVRDNADLWMWAGFAAIKYNDKAAAKSAFEKSLSIDPGNANAKQGMEALQFMP
jgi:Tfp pilus assembly protein PilF